MGRFSQGKRWQGIVEILQGARPKDWHVAGCSDRMSWWRIVSRTTLRSALFTSQEVMMRLATSPSRFLALFLAGLLILGVFQVEPLSAQEATLSEEERREQVAAERFLELLLKRP